MVVLNSKDQPENLWLSKTHPNKQTCNAVVPKSSYIYVLVPCYKCIKSVSMLQNQFTNSNCQYAQ